MPNQSRSEGTCMAGQVTIINTDDVSPEVRALLADRDRWRKRAANWKAAAKSQREERRSRQAAWQASTGYVLDHLNVVQAKSTALRERLAEAERQRDAQWARADLFAGVMQSNDEELALYEDMKAQRDAAEAELDALRVKLAETCEALEMASVWIELHNQPVGWIPEEISVAPFSRHDAVWANALRALVAEVRRGNS